MTQSLGINHPALVVNAAFDDNPDATVTTWYSLDTNSEGGPRIESCEIRRGRNNELARDDAGTARLTIENQDRELDPLNEDGPYYPDVDAGRRVQVSLVWKGITYPVFQGAIDKPDPEFRGNGTVSFLNLECTDGLAALNLFPLVTTTGYPAELGGTRIDRVLDAIGWPAGERRTDAGSHMQRAEVVETLPDGTVRLDLGDAKGYLEQVTDAEGGRFFIGHDGYAVFQDRRYRLDIATAVSAHFNDAEDPTGIQYLDTPIEWDVSNLYNDVTYTLATGNVEHIENAASIARYRRRGIGMDGPLQRPGEAAAAASLKLYMSKDPVVRMPSITVQPVGDDWDTILPLLGDLSKRVNVRRVQSAGSALDFECFIEGFSLSIGQTIAISFDISPDRGPTDEWILGTSALDVDAFVGV